MARPRTGLAVSLAAVVAVLACATLDSEMLCVPSSKKHGIPLLSPWGLLLFGLLLTGAMYATIWRRGAPVEA